MYYEKTMHGFKKMLHQNKHLSVSFCMCFSKYALIWGKWEDVITVVVKTWSPIDLRGVNCKLQVKALCKVKMAINTLTSAMMWVPQKREPCWICRSLICIREQKPGTFLSGRAILRRREIICSLDSDQTWRTKVYRIAKGSVDGLLKGGKNKEVKAKQKAM